MIQAQRQHQILQEILQSGFGNIVELSEKFGISEMTIRRDLRILESEGYIRCTRGGAVIVQPSQAVEPLYTAKEQAHINQKRNIARYAVEHFVSDNDVIALEAGTTVGAMVEFLTDKQHLTVVTNGLRTTNLLHQLPNITTICTGGILRSPSSTFVGPVAEEFFGEFYVNKLFLSGQGFTFNTGVTDPQMIDTQVKKAMIAAASQVMVLLDSSKFGVKSMTPVIGTRDIQYLVTDEDAPTEVLDELRLAGVDVHVVGK
jgi:DeoR/GlpR family transcriptional regulator of sugar metabolism